MLVKVAEVLMYLLNKKKTTGRT